MNIFDILNRGAAHAPKPPEHKPAVVRAAETTRKQWLDALQVDQVRAWMDLGQQQVEVLRGLATVLTLAGFAQAHDLRTEDTPEQRIIRGALSAAAQCGEAGAVISVADAKAFGAACDRAADIIKAASVAAIINAAERMQALSETL